MWAGRISCIFYDKLNSELRVKSHQKDPSKNKGQLPHPSRRLTGVFCMEDRWLNWPPSGPQGPTEPGMLSWIFQIQENRDSWWLHSLCIFLGSDWGLWGGYGRGRKPSFRDTFSTYLLDSCWAPFQNNGKEASNPWPAGARSSGEADNSTQSCSPELSATERAKAQETWSVAWNAPITMACKHRWPGQSQLLCSVCTSVYMQTHMPPLFEGAASIKVKKVKVSQALFPLCDEKLIRDY